jgi:endonuclease/exonuclease/phosphatase family metal-dependent hydrolase
MKIISLNTWGGRLHDPIDTFVKQHATSTDIFCFQEIYSNGTSEANQEEGERPNFFEELQGLLEDFTGFFAEQQSGTGLATFVRNTLKIEGTDSHLILSSEELSHLQMPNGVRYYPRIVQIVTVKEPHLTFFNFHGVPGGNKRDTAERELQMKRLHKVLDKFDGEKVLVGDFNLNPDTEAIHGLEDDMRNLVIDGGFKTTRTSHYAKRATFPFADYTFVTPGTEVLSFEVLPDEVSDHSPMQLVIG